MVAGVSLHADVFVRLNGFTLDARLDAPRGEITAVLGPNGSGKTTLLRSLAGLTPLDRGRVELDGRTLEDASTGHFLPARSRNVGYVFQDSLLFPHLSALDNVAYAFRAAGNNKRQARALAHEAMTAAGIAEVAPVKPLELSGGRRQKVALLRALAVEPRMLLLDEPTTSVDAVSRPEIRGALLEQVESFGGVTLLVTHDPIEALTLASRIYVLESGTVVQSGRPDELAARPRTQFVAELVGVNLWRGHADRGLIETDRGVTLVTADDISGDVIAIAHPHAIALHKSRVEGSPRNVWRGRIEALEPTAAGRVRARIAGDLPLIAEVTSAALAELDLARGADVWASLKATEVSVYEA
jgi:molybdate transport system ATP-binding protein